MKKFFYRVQKGDGVLSLSQKLNLPTLDLIKDNNLNKEIEEGDILFINCPDNVYFVKPQDTVEGIAEQFSTTSNDILTKNEIPYIFYGLMIKL